MWVDESVCAEKGNQNNAEHFLWGYEGSRLQYGRLF